MTSETLPQTRHFNLWHLSLILVLIGIVVSGYLSYVKLTETATVCLESGAFNCEVVQNSAYAEMAGIPIAYLGVGVYVLIGALLLLQNRISFLQEYGIMILFGVVLFSWVYSMYLVYLQVVVLQSLCVWCLAHEVTMTLLFVVTIFRLKNELTAN